jgi:hypothetical protein
MPAIDSPIAILAIPDRDFVFRDRASILNHFFPAPWPLSLRWRDEYHHEVL